MQQSILMSRNSLRAFVLSAIGAFGLTACNGEVVAPQPPTPKPPHWVYGEHSVVGEEFGSWAEPGDLYDDECSVVYLTNEVWVSKRNLNSSSSGVVTARSEFRSGNIHQAVFYDPYLQYLIPGSNFSTFFSQPVRYGSALEVSVKYPSNVFYGDVPDSSFDLYFTDLDINYGGGENRYWVDYDTGAARDCHAVYNVVLYNEYYPEKLNARVGTKAFPGVKIEEAKPRSKSGARVSSSKTDGLRLMAASTRFDLLEYAISEASKGVPSATPYVKFANKAEFREALKKDRQGSDVKTRLGIARVMKIMKDVRQETKSIGALLGSKMNKLEVMERYSKLPKGLRTNLEAIQAFSESLPKAE